ncbi:MAG: DUF4932 domain-containing protein [Acidobacteria bacterium]|nr:DUF4932 domain-containing protein [Acidobacteriota bacterium]
MLPLAAQDLRIGVDPRVELFSILFRLAGSPEYNSGTIPSYNQATDRYFTAFRGHDAVLLARQMWQRYGIGYDAVMSLAVHTDGVPELNERVALDWPGRVLDSRWQPAATGQFLEAARRFAVETDFVTFLEQQSVLVTTTTGRMRKLVEENVDLEWFPRFYGKAPGAALFIVPGLTNGTSSYGPRFVGMDGAEELFAIIGIFSLDGDGMPVFSTGVSSTVVHEFSHSFVNPSVDRIMNEIRASGDAVWRQVAEPMRAQGYSNGQALLYESVVRAASARYSLAHGGWAAGLDAVRYEQGRSFFWTERLYELLGEYEGDRERYPDLDAFLPRIAGFFLSLPDELPGIIAAYQASRPRVVSSVPQPNEVGVDPGLTRIEVRFDRPMRNSWSVYRVAGKDFPAVVRASYDEEHTVFTLEVRLEAGRSYTLSFNNESGGNFMTEERMRIDPYVLTFSTR